MENTTTINKWIVYLTVNLVNNKIYIGVHKTDTPDKFDGYLGCAVYTFRPATYKHPKTPFQYAVKKYGVSKFRRVVLKSFDNETEAYAFEGQLVTESFIARKNTYNLIVGGRLNTNHANQYVKVYMYGMDGKYIREFETVTAANKFVDPNATSGGHLPRAIKRGHVHKGYQFSYEKVPCMKNLGREYKAVEGQGVKEMRPIGKYTLDGEFIERFECLSDATKAGYKNCKMVITGKRNSCKGFSFKYLD